MSYFFSLEDLGDRAERAGFDIEELRYICVINRNKKTGKELRRVFVHGVFVKPSGHQLEGRPLHTGCL